jgi:hypothetical protein
VLRTTPLYSPKFCGYLPEKQIHCVYFSSYEEGTSERQTRTERRPPLNLRSYDWTESVHEHPVNLLGLHSSSNNNSDSVSCVCKNVGMIAERRQ